MLHFRLTPDWGWGDFFCGGKADKPGPFDKTVVVLPGEKKRAGYLVPVVVKKDVVFSCRIFIEQQLILGRLLKVQGDHLRSGPVPVVA